MAQGRRKGANYERKIAKILSEWSGIKLRRTPLSGGWARENPSVSGDLVSVEPDKEFPIHVECKNNESWNWNATLEGIGPVYDWWDQATRQCPENKVPILVFSKAYHSDWVLISETALPYPERLDGLIFVRLTIGYIIKLDDFLKIYSLQDFSEASSFVRRSDIRQREGDPTGPEI